MRTPSRALLGWCLFDVANSSYTTLIITVAFNVIFTKLIVGPDAEGSFAAGNSLWAWTLAASWGAVAVLGPWLGVLSDAHGWRKRFLVGSVLLCCAASSFFYALEPGSIAGAIALLLLSNIGYSLSENFIAAFLPSVARPEAMGRISGLAWGLGYFGGLLSIVLCQVATGLDYRLENWSALRWIGPMTAAFFLCASVPALLWLREPPVVRNPEGAFAQFRQAFRDLRRMPDLSRLLISCFFFQGALAIVISFAAIYGEQVVGLTGGWQAAFFLTLQVSAALGAFFFGWLQSRWGGMRTLNLTLYVWVLAVALIVFLPSLAAVWGVSDLKLPFLLVGNLAGLCLGATQSCARALVGQFAPVGKAGEVFGFWGFSTKLAMVFALLVFGLLQRLWGLQAGMFFCAALFAVSRFLHLFIDERRGRARAS